MKAIIKTLGTLRGLLAENDLERKLLMSQVARLEAEFNSALEDYSTDRSLTPLEKATALTSKIEAIKLVRARTKLGLKEAKDLVWDFLAAAAPPAPMPAPEPVPEWW